MEAPFSIYPRNRIKAADFYIETDYKILHEDEHLLVIDKPAPLAVHPVGSYFELNLHTLLKKDPRYDGMRIRFVHRLDAETSGVIVATKTPEAARSIGIEFLNGRVKKKYEALVFGKPEQAGGLIEIPLGDDESSGFHTVRVPDYENGEASATRYETLWSEGEYSYLSVEPLTGRTHQIRAHLSFIGHPVVGDKIYINLENFKRYVVGGIDAEMMAQIKLRRLALHACHISFTHPATRETVEYSSKAPDFLKAIPQ